MEFLIGIIIGLFFGFTIGFEYTTRMHYKSLERLHKHLKDMDNNHG